MLVLETWEGQWSPSAAKVSIFKLGLCPCLAMGALGPVGLVLALASVGSVTGSKAWQVSNPPSLRTPAMIPATPRTPLPAAPHLHRTPSPRFHLRCHCPPHPSQLPSQLQGQLPCQLPHRFANPLGDGILVRLLVLDHGASPLGGVDMSKELSNWSTVAWLVTVLLGSKA